MIHPARARFDLLRVTRVEIYIYKDARCTRVCRSVDADGRMVETGDGVI